MQHTRTEKLLLEAARVFNSTMDYEELIQLVLRLVMKAVDAESALVYRFDPNRPGMNIRHMKSPEFTVSKAVREPGTGIVGWVAQHREPIIVADARNDPRIDKEFQEVVGTEFRTVISLPLVGKGHMIGVVEAINKADGEFTEEDLDILTGLNNQIAVAVDNAHLYRKVKREALQKNLLYETGKKLSGSLSLDEVLRTILDSLKQAVDYNLGAVFLVDDVSGDMRSIYTVGYDPSSNANLRVKFGQGIVSAVVTDGESIIVPDVEADERYFDNSTSTRSEIAVPIQVDDRVIGVINLESDQLDAYGDRDASLILAFASQAGISVERARLHENLLAARKLEEQLNVAREIQRSFLPDIDPDISGYEVTGRNISSGQVGGDYYDFIHIVEQHTGIAIADVSGKGIPAALIMASFRASLIAEIRNNYSIRTIGEKVNSLLKESVEPGNYVTGVYGVLDSKNHILTFSNFGHNPPILLREGSEVEYLREGGPVLGVTDGVAFEERALVINPGDVLVLYTDGVTEVFAEDGAEFGLSRLVDTIREHRLKPATAIADAIYTAVTEFAPKSYTFDDLTMVVVKRLQK